MHDTRNKLEYMIKHLSGIYSFFANTEINDFAKRCILRRFFILFDSYLKILPAYKNDLVRSGQLAGSMRASLEGKILGARTDWDEQYDIIRDKFGAHYQEGDVAGDDRLDHELSHWDWWNEIDYSTVSLFYDHVLNLSNAVSDLNALDVCQLANYEDIDFSGTPLSPKDGFFIGTDDLAGTKLNTVAEISLNGMRKKCQRIRTILNLIEVDCWLTSLTEARFSPYLKSYLIAGGCWRL